jgi:hypothetical protein
MADQRTMAMRHYSGIDQDVWQRHAWRNRVHSLQLLLTMGGFLALLGWLVWGWDGILILLSAGALSVLLTPRISPRWVMRLYGASLITPQRSPRLHALVKIERVQGRWMERLFMPGRGVPEPSLLRTHPPTGERVQWPVVLRSQT